jgi:hypothetical protein
VAERGEDRWSSEKKEEAQRRRGIRKKQMREERGWEAGKNRIYMYDA